MFVTKNQILVFIACVAFGAFVGLIFNFSAGIKFFIKNKFCKCLCDVLFALPLGLVFTLYSYSLHFPNFRLYMLVGIYLGVFLYFKSFYIILAKYCKKIYNICKEKRKKLENDRTKGKKINRRRHGRRSVTDRNFVDGYDLSNDTYNRLQQAH